MILDFDKYSLIIDGKRVFVRSAAFHYFRNPGNSVWKDRLSKLKACGYNTIDLYFCWGYHSKHQGVYDFTDIRDVRELLQIASELGLYVIARPGPYINAELSAGGLPLWLFNVPDIVFRNRQMCEYKYSSAYMHALKEWYCRIISIVNEYNNVIALQIENEYSTNSAEPDYIQELYDFVRNLGVKVPLFHNDAYGVGLYSDIVNIYAVDVYPTINFNDKWRENPNSFDVLDFAEENIREFSPNSPMFIAELQSGWFDKWFGYGYEKIRSELGREHINIVTKTALSQGITMFNHYMACGGTSWDELGCAEVCTSYDFAAPISEYGIPQENYYQAKEINYFLQAFNLTETKLVANEEEILHNVEENIFARLRFDRQYCSNWLFIRNLNSETKDIQLKNGYKFALEPYDMKILPQNLDLLGCKLEFSSMSLFGKIQNETYEKIFVIIEEEGELILSDFNEHDISKNLQYCEEDKKIIIKIKQFVENGASFCKFTRLDKTTEFIFIDRKTADKTWLINEKAYIGCDFVLEDDKKLAFNSDRELEIMDLTDNPIKKHNISINHEKLVQLAQIKPEPWNIFTCSPEIDNDYDYSSWNLVENGKLDCIENRVYDGFIWYKGSYEGIIEQLQLNAKHCWSIYINEKHVKSYDSLFYDKGTETNEIITVIIDTEIQNTDSANQITILVQNLGFDKGFQNEVNIPRGIISFESFPYKNIEWSIRGGLTPEIEEWDFITPENIENASKTSYLYRISTQFKINSSEDIFAPKYLTFENPSFDKALVYLNGNLIGKYWKSANTQSQFLLMDGFLKENNVLSLVIWDNYLNQQIEDFNNQSINVNIKIGNIDIYSLVDFSNPALI